MSLSNIKDYEEDIVGTTIELLGQKTNMFNAASGGAIVLSTEAFQGSFNRLSFFQSLSTARRRVDRKAANATQAATPLNQAEHVGVKVAGGFGPVSFEPADITWLRANPAEAIRAISEGFSDTLLQDQLNTAVMAGVAAVKGQAALINDVSATAGITLNALNNSHAKFGDQSALLVADIMTGAVWHKLVDKALTNSNQLFASGNVMVVDILGKRYVVSDIPALYETGTPNKDLVLSVVANGIIVDNTGDILTNIETSNGKTRIETTFQADYTFGLKMKGYSWDVTNGGKSPDDAALATSTNWDKDVTENKHTLGTLAIGDAAM